MQDSSDFRFQFLVSARSILICRSPSRLREPVPLRIKNQIKFAVKRELTEDRRQVIADRGLGDEYWSNGSCLRFGAGPGRLSPLSSPGIVDNDRKERRCVRAYLVLCAADGHHRGGLEQCSGSV